MNELPPQDVLRSQIATINDSLRALAERATSQFSPFDESSIPNKPRDEVGIVSIKDPARSAAFWNHYISGTIASVRITIEYAELKGESIDEDLIRELQARTIRDTRLRLSSMVELPDRTSCEAYLQVSGAFDWSNAEARRQGFFNELNEAVLSLADNYMHLSGQIHL